ncbi:MAG: hypothetical protein C0469_18630 [Cyanobacteria bacterium DS2.3.42]|nr:hypothetical protein [Cyanobacteria bacterium DS2.3.42]
MQSSRLTAFILFIACITIYLANGRPLGSGDTITNTLVGFNLLENHRIDCDNFRGKFHHHANSYWFVDAPNGQLVPYYPVGPAIVSFPLCIGYWASLKTSPGKIDVTSATFENQRQTFEHLASSVIAATSVVLFFLSSRLLFNLRTSIITSIVFAFCTNVWVTSSQALWQHGSSNMMTLGSFYALLRANRASGDSACKTWILVAGVCCGMLPAIRPSGLIFLLAFGAYCIIHFRKDLWLFGLGLLSCIPTLAYNLKYAGSLLGGYKTQFNASRFSTSNFSAGFTGVLFSPNRGLFVFCPVVVFAWSGISHLVKNIRSSDKDNLLLLLFSVASLLHCALFFFFNVWWGGHCYGPRYMTDGLPAFIFLINYFVVAVLPANSLKHTVAIIAFAVLAFYSMFVQIVGAFGHGGAGWDSHPLNVDKYHKRLWDFKDTAIKRHFTALRSSFFVDQEPTNKNPQYLFGKVLSITDESGHPLPQPLVVHSGEKQVFIAEVQNLGSIRWTGYLSGDYGPHSYVNMSFVDSSAADSGAGGMLYVAKRLRPVEKGIAMGEVTFPSKCGDYKLNAQMEWGNIAGNRFTREPFFISIRVVPR